MFSLLYAALFSFFHPFFISMTDVNFNNDSHELEISIRMFTDDFEKTLRSRHKDVNIDIAHPVNQTQMNSFVNEYIQKNLSFSVNGQPAMMGFAGYEQEQESTWTYFLIRNVSAVKQLSVVNTLLNEYNQNQVNLIHIKVNGKEQNNKLDYPDSKAEFDF